MADTLPTTWPADPHTLAKHAILQRYLQAWFPILTQQASALARQYGKLPNREVLFIDGFAGPGEYSNGKEGSPVIALKAALNHSIPFPIPVRMLFGVHSHFGVKQLRRNRLAERVFAAAGA